ncbi:hypothetical protein [Nesterenkonia pannonica]|uniref:MnhB domain-containing protein n=1 Tax=Nesterenkonia pannonica TaxID=1548602 RepID=UPI002164E173|nr:MnhB domain-containing protein [Nesterenkonia pannonica]
MLAALGALALMDPARLSASQTFSVVPRNLSWMVRAAAPVLLVAGMWLLFAGSTDSGGAFQSGAVLTALLILLRVSGRICHSCTGCCCALPWWWGFWHSSRQGWWGMRPPETGWGGPRSGHSPLSSPWRFC